MQAYSIAVSPAPANLTPGRTGLVPSLVRSKSNSSRVYATPPQATSDNTPPPPPVPRRKKTFSEVMGFSGFAPEVINGRLAQLGFVAGLGAEIATGESFPDQFSAHWGSFLFATGVVTLATFIPSFNSVTYTADPKTKKDVFGPFSESAELFNSRGAMIGIAAMLAIESVKGGPLITLNAKSVVPEQQLTAAVLRQQVIDESRNDGFEPRTVVPQVPAEYFSPPAPTPAEPTPAPAAPAAPADVAPAAPSFAPAAAVAPAEEPLTESQKIAKLQADVESLRAEMKAMNKADPSLESTIY